MVRLLKEGRLPEKLLMLCTHDSELCLFSRHA